MFNILIDMLQGKRRLTKKEVPAKEKDARKEKLQGFVTQLRELRATVTDKNVGQKTPEFYALTKHALRELLSIKYEATFQEIVEEMEKSKRHPAKLREELNAFLEDISMMEYGYAQFKEVLNEKRREQEKHLAEYIKEIERDGERVDSKTKKKISEIVSDSVPHSDREFLIKMMDDFKLIMHQIA